MVLRRIFQICAFAACVMGSTVAFALDPGVDVSSNAVAVTSTEATEPSPQGELDFGDLLMPEPTFRSCTATSQCTPVGGTPVSCVGVSTCSSAANWVVCDSVTTYCTCNPANIPTCVDPVGFCRCWSQSPATSWGACRQAYCI
jgi:hypothetical protein